MITGVVNGDYEPILRISIDSNNGELYERDAVVDTGFNGWLSLPPDLVVILELPWQRRGRAILADGSESIFDIYEATILWDGQPVTLPIDEADSYPLIGMSLMDGYELTIQIVDSGTVTLKKI
jgi:clan AA aspartic protease